MKHTFGRSSVVAKEEEDVHTNQFVLNAGPKS